jgi:hypothetical protein
MRNLDDQPMYRTFEEFEREELRRADTLAGSDSVFDPMFGEELNFDATSVRLSRRDEGDDEE